MRRVITKLANTRRSVIEAQRSVVSIFGLEHRLRNSHSCTHHYTRWDKDPVPCFHCEDYKADTMRVKFYEEVEARTKYCLCGSKNNKKDVVNFSVSDFKKKNKIDDPFSNMLSWEKLVEFSVDAVRKYEVEHPTIQA